MFERALTSAPDAMSAPTTISCRSDIAHISASGPLGDGDVYVGAVREECLQGSRASVRAAIINGVSR